MRLEDLNWMDVEKYLQQEDRLMLVTGATEQHAYLSLLTILRFRWRWQTRHRKPLVCWLCHRPTLASRHTSLPILAP